MASKPFTFTFFNRTITNVHNHSNILAEVLRNNFMPAVTGQSVVSDIFRQFLSIRIGGIAATMDDSNKNTEYVHSRSVMQTIEQNSKKQSTRY